MPLANPIYFWSYITQMVVDSLFQFAVLVELGWGVLRPIRASLPKQSILILAVLIVLAGAVIWPIAAWTIPPNLAASGRTLVQVQQTFAVLRVVVFMALAGFSQILSIGWRNRELQIATGLGFYSMISLAVSLIHTHQTPGLRYGQLDSLGDGELCLLLALLGLQFLAARGRTTGIHASDAKFSVGGYRRCPQYPSCPGRFGNRHNQKSRKTMIQANYRFGLLMKLKQFATSESLPVGCYLGAPHFWVPFAESKSYPKSGFWCTIASSSGTSNRTALN